MVNESVVKSVRQYLRALQEQGITIKFGVMNGAILICLLSRRVLTINKTVVT
jgi:hypothetical protein